MAALRRAAIVAALIAILPGIAAGQARRWADPYRQGRDAVKAGRYDEGIPLLLQAIKVANRQERIKIVEGVDQTEYFPFYYLGLAYLRTKQIEAAEQAFNTAKQCRCLTADLADLLRVYESDLAKLKAAPVDKTAPPPPPPPPPEFEKRLSEAEAAAAGGRHLDAIRIYDSLRSMNAAEYAKRNLGAKRGEAERARAQELVNQGNQAAAAGQLTDARARYQEAENILQGSGRAGLEEITRRQNEYSRLKGGAEADARAGRADAARDKARQAGLADPQQFRADNLLSLLDKIKPATPNPPAESAGAERARELVKRAQAQVASGNYREAASLFKQAQSLDPKNADAAAWVETSTAFEELRDRGRQLHSEGKLNEAMQTLEDARRRDAQRFTAEGLDAIVKRIADEIGHLPEEQIKPVRAALIAYLQGDVARAVSMLEPLAANPALDPRARAHVHAYLGAAYGDLALSVRADTERADLRRKALEQFRQLIAVQPEYRMSEMLISPRIRELLAEARTKR
jgi:tetratricopeptide (TPR) repeat protein